MNMPGRPRHVWRDAMPNLMLAARLTARLCFALFVICALALGLGNAAQAQTPLGTAFNHDTTGFPLDVTHARQTCDSCHVQGTFRGTPRDCSTCHRTAPGAQKPPLQHIPTAPAGQQVQCSECHTTIAFAPSIFRHRAAQGVNQGNCATCHSGAFASQGAAAKPITHMPTSLPCDSCHKTSAWTPAGYTHALAAPGSCATCHNGARATGKPATHIPTAAACDSCHAAGVAWTPVSVGIAAMHANMSGPMAAGNCASCHSGAFVAQNAQAKPATHPPTAAQCDTCHASTTSWAANPKPDHAALTACASCHTGSGALGKPPTHVPTAAQCSDCHSTVTFKPAAMNHIGTGGQCASCHSGSFTFANALAKPTGHIPTAAQCDSCHTGGFVNWFPAAMNHAGLAGKCITCHSGGFISQNAQTKPPTHIATTAQCDSCHTSTTSWATATFNHATASPAAAGRCASCHNSVSALGKPVSHIPTAAQCDSCHANFTAFKPAQMNHSGMTGQCATCHNGSYTFANAQPKPINHVPTSAQCDSCHVSGFISWMPATMNHGGTGGLCSACHSGSYLAQNAQIKPPTHIATTAQCDTCHRSTTTWATVIYDHAATAAGTCATCHNGTSALGKPTNHIPTTAQCDTCHTGYSAFRPARMNHTGLAGQCATCHTGAYTAVNALAKPTNHIPTTGQCDSCHTGGFAAWFPATMNHNALTTGNCSSCHNGGYLAQNAQSKTPTHIATSAQCDSCHSSTVTWATATRAHSAADTGICSTCHNGTNALGKPVNHIPTTAQCDTCHSYTAPRFAPATMSHAGTTGPLAAGNCASCHSGTYSAVNARAKPATHVTTTAQCDTCHNSTVTWLGATYTHAASAAGTCATCHNGLNALGKNVTHIPTASQCDSCHGNFIAFRPARMSHAGTAAQCATCHSGSYTAVNALAKPATHIPTAAQCDTCHVNSFVNWAPATMSHAGLAGQCTTCHSGTHVAQNAQVKTPTHIPTTQQCDSSGCHNSTVSWATATFNHAAAVPAVAGRCSNCHNGTNALGKPTSHIPTTSQCDSCHSSSAPHFAPATMSHAGTTGPLATGNCSTCHGGAYTTVNAQAKPATHIPTTQSCDSCHNTTVWKPTSYSHQGVVAGSCATCHNGTTARGKLAAHLPTAAACDTCHTNYVAFVPARMNHAGTTGPAATGNCSTCHSGAYLAINAQVKPVTHVATIQQCDTCHTSTATWATAIYTHAASATGTCATCHNGVTALGKPTTHIPTSAQCDTCHRNYIGFRPAQMSHAATTGPNAAGNCATCHGGAFTAVNALTKPASHIPTGSQCDTCHVSGFVNWVPATMSHAGLAGQCSTCHSGAYVAQNAQVKTPAHIPTTQQCDACHSSTTTWATATFNHATASPAATGRCSQCHNGTSALGKPTNHIPTAQQCDTCHTTAAWRPTSFNHAGIAAGSCASCHNGISASGKPAGTHIPTAQSCDTCHRTGIAWLPLITPYPHAGVAAGTCNSCHGGGYPNIDVKSGSHVPTTAQCDICHTTAVWTPLRTPVNHATLGTGNCRTCHGGAYVGIRAKPAGTGHIPTALAGMPGDECSNCHTNTTTFAVFRMNHGSIQTSCATCHDRSAPYTYINGERITRNSSHASGASAATDCSSSNCHRPLGRRGTPYTKW
jgi:aspartate carbamoyltransferase regulatory subunit